MDQYTVDCKLREIQADAFNRVSNEMINITTFFKNSCQALNNEMKRALPLVFLEELKVIQEKIKKNLSDFEFDISSQLKVVKNDQQRIEKRLLLLQELVIPIHTLEISVRLSNVLSNNGIRTEQQLLDMWSQMGEKEFLKMNGMGKRGFIELREYIRTRKKKK